MAKIPIILEPGRADGKLIKVNSVYDDNQEKFLSDKITEIDDNHNTLNNTVNSLTDIVNNNKTDIEFKLETEKIRATNAENNLRETVNNITNINEHAATAELITVNTLPNSTVSNVQQALDDLYKNIIYDVSQLNGGIVFESLQALLNSSNVDTLIPMSVRHGGMSIRFIQGSAQSSDNKYVQYFLTKDDWSVSDADWEKMNLEEDVNQIDNIVNSRDILIGLTDGYWGQDLSPQLGGFHRAKLDISSYNGIIVNGSARGNAYISLVASDDTTILWQSNNISEPFSIDLSSYNNVKYLYYCYETSIVNNPYVKSWSLLTTVNKYIGDSAFQTKQKLNATKIINNLTTGGANDVLSAEQGKELNTQLNGSTTIEEVTITADQAGFIALSNGAINNPSSSWKHTILVPIDSFVSATGFINHASVAGIALYSSDSFDSYLGGFTRLNTNVVITDLSPYTSQYPTARYVAFSTDTSNITFVCKYNNTIEGNGLKNRVELLEGDISIINEDVNGLKSKVSSLRKISVSNKMLHISFDDTINAFKDLIDNNRASLFDSPFFGALKTLHDTYGCVFSCYCFYDMIDLKYVSKITTISSPSTTSIYYLSKTDESYSAGLYVYRNSTWTVYDNSTMRDDYILFSLSDMTNAYATELSSISNYLKFGFHGIDGLEYLKDIIHTPMEIKTAYDNTILDIVRITGTVKSIDMVPRLQGFGGSIDICRALRDCDCGCLGFLTSDYSETSSGQGGQSNGYYLTEPAPVVLWNKGQWYDYQERLHFYPSSLRLDGQTATSTETYMNKFLSVSKWGQAEMICMYCHENQMFINGSIASNYITSLTKVAEWAIKHDYLFGYPMDRIRMSF